MLTEIALVFIIVMILSSLPIMVVRLGRMHKDLGQKLDTLVRLQSQMAADLKQTAYNTLKNP